MKIIKLFFLYSICFFISAQSAEEILSGLPSDIKNSILEQASQEIDNPNVAIENNLSMSDDFEKTIEENEPYFGYNFFESNSNTKTPIVDIPLQSDYIISLNDELELLLTGGIQRTLKLRVDLSGVALIPELGAVTLAALTLSEANEKISSLVEKTYVGVESNLSVSKPSLKKISILGAVKRPGSYLVNPFISVSEAIKYAGGLLKNSSIRDISVKNLNGSSRSVDMYNFLIFGDRQSDENIQNGDTIIVSATSNFVNLSGEVLRPNIYEYRKNEKVEDLLKFSLGMSNSANLNNISIYYRENEKLLSRKVEIQDSVSDEVLTELNVGKLISVPYKEARVYGASVQSGSYSVNRGEKVSNIIEKLNFSGDIYPFYFLLKQTDNKNLSQENYNLSLVDPETYKNIVLKDNVEVTFYSRSDFLITSDEEESDQLKLLKEQIPSTTFKFITIGNKTLSLPISGRFTPEEIVNYIGINENLNLAETTVKSSDSIIRDSYKLNLDAFDIVSLTIPSKKIESFSVEIRGQVNAPGFYVVDSSSTLSELYGMAGGLKKSAFNGGIIIERESVRERQTNALNSAKLMLYDSLLSSSNMIDVQSDPNDYTGLISLAEEIEVSGRISGNFGFGTVEADQLTLEENDYIYVPYRPTTISIYGEVLNPLTTSFNTNFNYEDYIKLAGGFTKNADKSALYVIKANGESYPLRSRAFGKQLYLEPGDTIVIPRDTDKISTLPLVSIATKIISDIAFAAASLSALNN